MFGARPQSRASTACLLPYLVLLLLLACDGSGKRADSAPDGDASTRAQDGVNAADTEGEPERDASAQEDDPVDESEQDAGHVSDGSGREPSATAEDDSTVPTEQDAANVPAGDAGEPADAGAALLDASAPPDAKPGSDPELDASAPDADARDSAGPETQRDASGPICTQCGACEQSMPVTNADHRPEPVVYTDLPPAGGLHAACWTSWGVHTQEVPAGRWVHNQEHGAVVFLYNCPEGCADEVSALEALVPDRPLAIVVPYSAMAARFAVASWGHRIVSECLDIAAFVDFYARYANMGRESTMDPPPGGC